ncbi:hypothetical protein L484_013523 [Morus notabilis]|uniref:Uncharacterized protein n=1 Tax=Morus notabilis TaxID=981085 RepID=W9QQK6_9ROSA|nr:hypothetical protein L484_013523 [Morus notabilis]
MVAALRRRLSSETVTGDQLIRLFGDDTSAASFSVVLTFGADSGICVLMVCWWPSCYTVVALDPSEAFINYRGIFKKSLM